MPLIPPNGASRTSLQGYSQRGLVGEARVQGNLEDAMPTSTSPTSSVHDSSEKLLLSDAELVASQGDAPFAFDDPYAESELVTRHERIDLAIRQAQEQL
jgi:hypothetical protein